MILYPKDYANRPKHPGSVELKESLQFIQECPIPFCVNNGWNKWGMLGVISDYVLTWVKGDIIEIGIGESSYLFTHLARKFKRKVYHVDIQKSDYENLCTVGDFFDDSNVLFVGTSNEFFASMVIPDIALVFIDGDHMYEQVLKDFVNSFEVLVPGGFVFFHDLFPKNEEETAFNRSGNGYLFRKELETWPFDVFTFPYGSWDAGLTMVRKSIESESKYRKNGRIK